MPLCAQLVLSYVFLCVLYTSDFCIVHILILQIALSSEQICAGNVRLGMQMQQKLLCAQLAGSSPLREKLHTELGAWDKTANYCYGTSSFLTSTVRLWQNKGKQTSALSKTLRCGE